MKYNTQREKLKITDYGRNIYSLIQYTKTIEDRDRRSRMASAIVDTMVRIAGDEKDSEDYRRKYWVHLMILADWNLDVDIPYQISRDETTEFKPHPMTYNQGKVRYRHYGSVMERMIRRVADYPEGEERDELVRLLAHAMKRDYLLWNRDNVEDGLISLQLEAISENKIHLSDDFQYYDFRDYLKGTSEERRPNGTHKKKKKKKKPARTANATK